MGRVPCCEKNGLKRGPWTQEEDQKLLDYIHKHGYGNWRLLPKKAGRTDNEIKNYWNTHIRKRLLRMGIDPVTHNPRLDLLDLSSIINSSLYASASLMNPEILKFAASLFSSQENHQIISHLVQTQIQDSIHQEAYNKLLNPPCDNSMPFTQSNLVEPNENLYSSSFLLESGFQQQHEHAQLSDLHCNGIASSTTRNDFANQLPSYDYISSDYHGNDLIMEPHISETSTFHSNNTNQNFNFASVLSTPSSSPGRLNSNSTYINGTSIEDETESYVSNNMFEFQVSDILGVNEFM
ncbi:hypothetical protein RYX36_035063 [Vicia faba]